tara:strand:- start:1091 stop:2527 length:1437 start_codon:yes stop_codon:yes gene_type:complete
MDSTDILEIGSRRELFIDYYLVDSMDGVELRLHEPRDEGVALQLDQPWEAPYPCYFTVLKEEDRYRMYYRGRHGLSGGGGPSASTCYAESSDGVVWERPHLGLVEINGSYDNNAITTGGNFSGYFSVTMDTRPSVDPSERFKALSGSPPSAFVSEDGIHWNRLTQEPVMFHDKPAWDSQNVAFWSESEGCYVAYVREYKLLGDTVEESSLEYRKRYGKDGHGIRWISRTTSDDFVNWSPLVQMDCGDTPDEQLYTNGTHPYFRAPHIYISLAKRFMDGRKALSDEQAEQLVPDIGHRCDSSDSVFMTSRGGNRYDRTFMEGFIRPGPSPRDWISRDNTPALGVVPGGARDMYLYRLSQYGQPTVHLSRYSIRLDGFISVNADYSGGEFVTKPFKFKGDKLEINYATSAAGGIQVEILDQEGFPVAGYGLEDCPEFFGDEIDRVVEWENGPDVGILEGKVVRLRFYMKDADLYSVKFTD